MRFVSDNPAAVTVDAKGKAVAVGPGSATIYVFANNGVWDAVNITVDANPMSLSIINATKTMEVGTSQNLGEKLKLKPSNAVANLTWTSSNVRVATVDGDGVVTAVADGQAKITVQSENKKKASITITVYSNPTSMSLSMPTKTMVVGSTQDLGAKLRLKPANTSTNMTWTSSNEAVATFDGNGFVTAVEAGKATITVQADNGRQVEVTIRVKKTKYSSYQQ